MTQPICPTHRRFSGRDFSETELDAIRTWIATLKLTREALARHVCQEFGWINVAGKLKTMSCKVALLRMHRAGLITLPAPLHTHKKRQPLSTADTPGVAGGQSDGDDQSGMLALFPTAALVLDATELARVRLEVVQSKADRGVYHRLLQAHHYLGAGSMAGAQLRYLARSAEGEVLGALGFGASAWLVAGRDRFIGWSDSARRERLHLVVNNNRFLISPSVRTPNLASRLLALASRRIAADWLVRYGYSPVLLETFVQQDRFAGTCYRAANWIPVGITKGRGKLEKKNQQILPLKEILVFPLQKNFRTLLAD